MTVKTQTNKVEKKCLNAKWSYIVGGLILFGHAYFLHIIQLDYENNYLFNEEKKFHSYLNIWIPIFLVSMAVEILAYYFAKIQVYRPNDAISSLSLGAYSTIMKGVLSSILKVSAYSYVWKNFGNHFSSTYLPSFIHNPIFSWWVMFLGVEFCYYWVHRTGHTWSIGWATHSIHHSSEEYNLSTALRQSSLHFTFSWVYYIPLSLFFPPALCLFHDEFNLLYQFWIHTEAIGKLGPLEYILNTPSQHRVHHGTNSYCIDVNYGGTLCIFDRLFGTFAEERDTEIINYGITTPLNTFSPVAANLIPLGQVLDKFHRNKGINKLLVFWYGPGWDPASPPYTPSSKTTKFKKYDPTLSSLTNFYLVINSLISILVAQHYLSMFKEFSYPSFEFQYATIALVLLTFCIYSFAHSFDRLPRTIPMQFFSCFSLSLLLFSMVFYSQLEEISKTLIYATISFYFILSLYFIIRFKNEVISSSRKEVAKSK